MEHQKQGQRHWLLYWLYLVLHNSAQGRKQQAQLFDTSSLEKREKMSFWKVFDRKTCLFISFISLRSLMPTWYNLYSVKNQKVSAITFSSVKPSSNRTHECLFKRSGSTLDEEAVVLNGKHCLGPLLAKRQM